MKKIILMLSTYNTLTRALEEFKPMKGRIVKMFVCGPTVYDYPHIGHAKTYVAMDVVARYLRFKGYSVFYVQNITDIDDRIINRAKENGEDPKDLAERFLKIYYADMEQLNITGVNLFAKATQHVEEIIEQIQALIKKGYGYESNGSVYFEVDKFKDFGKLSRQKKEKLIAGARVEIDPDKKNPEDFALWKRRKEGEPFWPSPWGDGRPGWHIEDTAISFNYLGDQYDIHGGGIDLIFPHHESEIAIAESLSGKKPFVRYWMHPGFLKVDGEKMAKSLGNFVTIRKILEMCDSEVLRFFLLHTHYRSPIDFTYELLDEAKSAYLRLEESFSKVSKISKVSGSVGEDNDLRAAFEKTERKFFDSMDNDFNTREAITSLFVLSRAINQSKLNDRNCVEEIKDFWGKVSQILGLFSISESEESREDLTEKLISAMIEIRDIERKSGRYDFADAIRKKLEGLGIKLEDTKEGTEWKLV
jgi:cysteinyl-tRNA synthetase (EC 6.1.1.16)